LAKAASFSRFDTSGPRPEGPGFGRHAARGHVRAERMFTWCNEGPGRDLQSWRAASFSWPAAGAP
jgi:hypothetical protein